MVNNATKSSKMGDKNEKIKSSPTINFMMGCISFVKTLALAATSYGYLASKHIIVYITVILIVDLNAYLLLAKWKRDTPGDRSQVTLYIGIALIILSASISFAGSDENGNLLTDQETKAILVNDIVSDQNRTTAHNEKIERDYKDAVNTEQNRVDAINKRNKELWFAHRSSLVAERDKAEAPGPNKKQTRGYNYQKKIDAWDRTSPEVITARSIKMGTKRETNDKVYSLKTEKIQSIDNAKGRYKNTIKIMVVILAIIIIFGLMTVEESQPNIFFSLIDSVVLSGRVMPPSRMEVAELEGELSRRDKIIQKEIKEKAEVEKRLDDVSQKADLSDREKREISEILAKKNAEKVDLEKALRNSEKERRELLFEVENIPEKLARAKVSEREEIMRKQREKDSEKLRKKLSKKSEKQGEVITFGEKEYDMRKFEGSVRKYKSLYENETNPDMKEIRRQRWVTRQNALDKYNGKGHIVSIKKIS